MQQLYLSDGVYATIDKANTEYPVILTTGSHERHKAESIIYMESVAMRLLIKAYTEELAP